VAIVAAHSVVCVLLMCVPNVLLAIVAAPLVNAVPRCNDIHDIHVCVFARALSLCLIFVSVSMSVCVCVCV
jgi:hypothetical protein